MYKEGTVVQSKFFITGCKADSQGPLLVGTFTKLRAGLYGSEMVDDTTRAEKSYVIISAKEELPRNNEYNRKTTYTNRYVAKELNPDNTYNEDGEEIQFSTAHSHSGSIKKEDIIVVGQMKKTFVWG
jgi:hypothetical protein